jgi:uncharacterized protein YgiM (DUF1202 family)
MNRRFLGILILLTVVLLLSACGGGATPTPTTAPTEPAPTEAAEPEDTATEAVVEEEEAAATEEETETATEAAEDEEAEEADVTEESAEASAEGDEVEALPEGTVVVVNFQNTTVRNGPGTSFEVVGSVAVGDRLPVVARTERTGTALWYLVTLESGENAWVWSRVVSLEPGDAEVEVAATIPAAP